MFHAAIAGSLPQPAWRAQIKKPWLRQVSA